MSLGKNIEWVYAALIADYIIKGILFIGRFRGGRWKKIQIEREQVEVLDDAPEHGAG
jgi:Na+-driven multidrug efflux pump